jgi:ribokinase
MDVTVLGSANLDVVVRVARLPAPGETVLALGRDRLPGGKGLNQAVAAARAGARTTFVAAVGRDDAADLLLATLRDAGVDASAVGRSDRPTGTALVTVQVSGENSIVVDPGANTDVRPAGPGRAAVTGARVLLAQLEVPLPVVAEEAGAARDAGVTVVLNAAPSQPLPTDLLAAVDVLLVNQHELRDVTGLSSVDVALAALADQVPAVVVTLGADGARWRSADGDGSAPGLAAQVVDTTGAGDAFAGTLAAALAAGSGLGQAVRRGTAAGALSVERAGAAVSMPTGAEIDARLAR